MNNSISWQCPTCNERHDKEFETCWKCGTLTSGARDPDFEITEPVTEIDQRPATGIDCEPKTEWPAIVYFSIPISMMGMVTTTVYGEVNGIRHPIDSPGLMFAVMIVWTFGMIFMVFPALLRTGIAWLARNGQQNDDFSFVNEIKWWLSWYILPQSIQQTHGWFRYFYYGSLASIPLSSIGTGLWRFVLFTQS